MTSFDRFERSLPMLLDELAAPQVPDYYPDILTRTKAMRQRPEWSFPERWLNMSAITRRLPTVPVIPFRIGLVVALLAIAALVAVLVSGALFKPRPAPYGPAVNGLIAIADDQGRILLADSNLGTSRVLIPAGANSDPLFSQDGTRVFYESHLAGGAVNLMVAGVDGSSPLALNPAPIQPPSYGGWSAHGDRFLIVDSVNQMLLYDTSKTAEPANLSTSLKLGQVSVGLGYNFLSSAAFRPPTGDEVVFTSLRTQKALMAVKLDGSGLRTLIDPNGPVSYSDMKGAEWSPDGSRLLVLLNESTTSREAWHLFVVNADGSDLHAVGSVSKDPLVNLNSPHWSPDGTRIAFQYWVNHANDDGQDFNPIAIVDVATGTMHEYGRTFTNGYASWEWSPDGSAILEAPGDQDGANGGDILIVDATKGTISKVPWQANSAINWQRTAR